MSIKLQWTIGKDLSALHAAARLSTHHQLADQRLAAAIKPPVEEIAERLELAETNSRQFWQSLIDVSPEGPAEQTRVTHALLAAGCAELTADTVATAITRRLADVRMATQEIYPRLDEQLPLRGRPMREQWEARGPGLLRYIGKLSHPDLVVKRAKLVLVHPAAGGGGGAVPEAGWGWIEAVLTNVVPGIPETVRIGWLLAILGIGHSQANRLVPTDRLPRLAAIASLPIVLQAAAEVELIEGPESLIAAAIQAWELDVDVELVKRWWQQQRDGSVPFAVGIKALDRMLETV